MPTLPGARHARSRRGGSRSRCGACAGTGSGRARRGARRRRRGTAGGFGEVLLELGIVGAEQVVEGGGGNFGTNQRQRFRRGRSRLRLGSGGKFHASPDAVGGWVGQLERQVFIEAAAVELEPEGASACLGVEFPTEKL